MAKYAKAEKVCKNARKYVKGRKSTNKYAKVRKSMQKYGKVCKSMQKYAKERKRKVRKSTQKCSKVCFWLSANLSMLKAINRHIDSTLIAFFWSKFFLGVCVKPFPRTACCCQKQA